jgi:hypothetical protein
MDEQRARALLEAERTEVRALLDDAETGGQEDRETEDEGATGDYADAAQPLTAEGMDDAIAESMRWRGSTAVPTAGPSRAGRRFRTSASKPTPPPN